MDGNISSLYLLTRMELMSSAGENIWVHYVPYTMYESLPRKF